MSNLQRARLAAALRSKEPLAGLVTKMVAPSVVEMAGFAGLDVVVLDTEHGPADTAAMEEHLRAADGADVAVLVRVGSLAGAEVLRALDAGAAGVVVPHVSDPGEARQAVMAAHYPPMGRRGLAMTTRAGHQTTADLATHLSEARRDTVVVVQVEDPAAVAATAAIAAVPGVSAVWVGASDLSLELGVPGQVDHPLVRAAIAEVGRGLRTMEEGERPALLGIATDAADAQRWREAGATVLLQTLHGVVMPALRTMASDRERASTPAHRPAAEASTSGEH